jgi:hypothetical protein
LIKVRQVKGFQDYWIIKTDSNGNKVWDKTYGGNDLDVAKVIQQTSDGGYIVGGTSISSFSGDKSQSSRGQEDYWLVKMDANGNKVWDKDFGANLQEYFQSLQQTSDGGFVFGGYSTSDINGNKTEPRKGALQLNDYWIVKINSNGIKVWDKTYGGADIDDLYGIQQTSDGGYILGGSSRSGVSVDKSDPAKSNYNHDYWLIKLGPNCSDLTATLTSSCNSSGGTGVSLNIAGLYSTTNCTPYWTLTYTENGVSKTASGTTPTASLAQNAAVGAVFTLNSITAGTCTSNLTSSFTVQPVPAAPVVISGSRCGTGSVNLSASGAPAGGRYVWYNVASGGTALSTNSTGTFASPTISSPTIYYVAVTNNAGCEGTRSPVTATIDPLPVVNGGPSETVFANAAPIQLTGFSPLGGTWSGLGVNSTGLFTPSPVLVGTQTLTYSYTANGCTGTSSKQIFIPTPPSPPSVNLIAPDTLISSVIGDSYEWTLNGSSLPNTARKLKATVTGMYAVRVINTFNGPSNFSQNYNFTVSGIKEQLNSGINLYPNPASGIVNINIDEEQAVQVTILNSLGQILFTKTVVKTRNNPAQLDLSKISKGIYLVQIKTEKQVIIKKLIVE